MSEMATSSGSATAIPNAGTSVRLVLWYILPSAFVLALMVLFLVESFTISGKDAIYPRILILLLLLISVINIVMDARGARSHVPLSPYEVAEADIEGGNGRGIDIPRTLAAALIVLLFPVVAILFGFFPGIIVLTLGLMWILGIRTWWVLLLATVLIVGSAYLIFSVGLGVHFPGGVII